jgi:tRNA A-37 threonylcarbamoyl transferase component Bud32
VPWSARLFRELAERELTQPAEVVLGKVSLQRLSARQRVYRVRTAATDVVVKQALTAAHPGALTHELDFYDSVNNGALRHSELAGHVPVVVSSEPSAATVVLETVHGILLAEELFGEGRARLPGPAATFGTLVAGMHGLRPTDQSLPSRAGISLPSIFNFLFPDSSGYLTLTGGQIEILRTLQRFPDLMQAVSSIRDTWSDSAFIHGDLSLSNVMISTNGSRIVLLDWEHAGPGDPGWDIGTVLAEWLGHWILSIPIVPAMSISHLSSFARLPLHLISCRIEAFWTAYAKARGYPEAATNTQLLAATQFAGVRLFQKTLEHAYARTALSGHEQLLMQLGMNLVMTPERAIGSLFGSDDELQ